MKTIEFNNVFEKDEYIQALVIIANADGKVLDQEKKYIEERSSMLNVVIDNEWKKNIKIEELKNLKYISRATKMTIIYDCITLSQIDNDFDEKENRMVYEIAGYLGISESIVSDIETWINDYKKLLDRGLSLMGYPVKA